MLSMARSTSTSAKQPVRSVVEDIVGATCCAIEEVMGGGELIEINYDSRADNKYYLVYL